MSSGDHKVSKITSEAIFAVRPISSTKFLISSQTGVLVIVAEDPITCVARGGGRALEIMDKYDIDLLSTE